MTHTFEPTRDAGLARLTEFLPQSASRYASNRNYDRGPGDRGNVSVLSPYIRHRLVTEDEVVRSVLQRYAVSSASKFIQEVCWRTYWKGWLEMRPSLWRAYTARVASLHRTLETDAALRLRYEAAVEGRTGIACFDAWVNELKTVGYVHNHARMWFASIWIFTLELPWELGADLFFRNLYDGDPASNTLSWRWVAGLHTVGKAYLARAANIAEYTEGRFQPTLGELAATAPALHETETYKRVPLPVSAPIPAADLVLLVTEEDCNPETLPLDPAHVAAIAVYDPASSYTGHAPHVVAFKQAAVNEAANRAAARFGCEITRLDGANAAASLHTIASNASATAIVTGYVPVGPLRDSLLAAGIAQSAGSVPLVQVRRAWDTAFWPHAAAGFFKLKEKIPSVIEDLVLRAA